MLTPSQQAQLQEIVSKVGIEDPDGQQVEVEGLQAHPGEDTQQEVVEDGSSDPAGRWGALRAAPHTDQEGKIQEKQAAAQSYVDLRGIFRLEPLQREPGREGPGSSPKKPQLTWGAQVGLSPCHSSIASCYDPPSWPAPD